MISVRQLRMQFPRLVRLFFAPVFAAGACGGNAVGTWGPDLGVMAKPEAQTNGGDGSSAIQLPRDQFAHRDSLGPAPAEWWWHVGTLETPQGRRFGFEITAAGYSANNGRETLGISQVSIGDVDSDPQVYYQAFPVYYPRPEGWAEYDTQSPWHVRLPPKGHSHGVMMTALDGDPLHMRVEASFTDRSKTCHLVLEMKPRQGTKPLLVWGTGVKEVNPRGTTPLTKNNYYYSLTHLKAEGTLTIGGDQWPVKGLTWMDHEYGAWKQDARWVLQDMQLSNGVHLSNYVLLADESPQAGEPMTGLATVLGHDGKSVPHVTFTTAVTSERYPSFCLHKRKYFQQFNVTLFNAEAGLAPVGEFVVTALIKDQVFRGPPPIPPATEPADIYEGVAVVEGHYAGQRLETSPGWIEQNLPTTGACP